MRSADISNLDSSGRKSRDSNHSTGPAFELVSAVHRRLILLRWAEHLGRGLFAGSVLAIILLCVAIWQGISTAPILWLCLGLAILISIVQMIRDWPTRLAAAMETDRQLKLDDLLSSLLLLPRDTSEDFAGTMRAMADGRCANASSSDIFLRRLGLRSWSAFGLAAAAAVTLAAIPLSPNPSQGRDGDMSILSTELANPPADAAAKIPGLLPTTHHPDSSLDSSKLVDAAAQQMPTDQKNATTLVDRANEQRNTAISNAAFQPSPGSASAKTSGNTLDRLTSKSPGRTSNQAGKVGAGGSADRGDSHENPVDQRIASTGGESSSKSGSAVTNVQMPGAGSTANPGDKSAALESQIPAEDRQLVHDFFDQGSN